METVFEHAGFGADVADSTDAYLDWLTLEARAHRALNHPWLLAFAECKFPDPLWAIRDYACAYSVYSAAFTGYLRAVIDKLDDPDHRRRLAHNLAEESGHLGADERAALRRIGIEPDTVDGVSHSALFRRFCTALSISPDELAVPDPAAVRWRNGLLNFLRDASPAAAVGALGLGTEGVVRHIYLRILAGIARLNVLGRRDYVFFELHCHVDDEHSADLLRIAGDLASDEHGRRELRHGMLTALDLRCEFWDALYRRALLRERVA